MYIHISIYIEFTHMHNMHICAQVDVCVRSESECLHGMLARPPLCQALPTPTGEILAAPREGGQWPSSPCIREERGRRSGPWLPVSQGLRGRAGPSQAPAPAPRLH